MKQSFPIVGNNAIMVNQGRLAGHFSRAEQIMIVDPNGETLATLVNPTASEGCSGKKKLIAILTQYNVNQVIVYNIGERMLGRLLNNNIHVMACRSTRLPLPELLAPTNLLPLTDPTQGRPSRRHQTKSAVSSCCHSNSTLHDYHKCHSAHNHQTCCGQQKNKPHKNQCGDHSMHQTQNVSCCHQGGE